MGTALRVSFILFVFCFSLIPLALFPSSQESPADPETPPVRFDYRALQPGEALKVSLDGRGGVEGAYIRYLGKRIQLGRSVYSSEFLAFLGLDLNMEPGVYPVEVYIQYNGGHEDLVRKALNVVSREFPVRRLWVEERYVTPPQSVNERIQREAALLRSLYRRYSSQWYGNGPFILPVAGKEAFNFGERRFFNDQPRSPHSGADISAPAGTPVKASNAGRVVLAADLYFSGLTVVIDHGLGVYSYYCHFSQIHAEQGKAVEKGEVIGDVGSTGRVTGPHLHWSVRINQDRVDPYSLLNLKF